MLPTASQIFEFLEREQTFTVEKHVVVLEPFARLRHGVRSMIRLLAEGEDHETIRACGLLRRCLAEWLTIPIPFDHALSGAIESVCPPSMVRSRWGDEAQAAYEQARQAAKDLQGMENPLQTRLCELITSQQENQASFKIFCSRNEKAHYKAFLPNIPDLDLEDQTFVHTLKQYRETLPFGKLFKIGPLRSLGWGSAPEALVSAPRFDTLVQIVWPGCQDDPDFGGDPVAPAGSEALASRVTWRTIAFPPPDAAAYSPWQLLEEEDDLRILAAGPRPADHVPAVLVQIADGQGILCAPRCQMLSFDPAAPDGECLAERRAGEDLEEGMFLVFPQHGEVDFGGGKGGAGEHCALWKNRLAHALGGNPWSFLKKLREGGIEQIQLDFNARSWCKDPARVLPAPGSPRHFKILLQALAAAGAVAEGGWPAARDGVPYERAAWREVRGARGAAIHNGRQEHAIISGALLAMLRGGLAEIREGTAADQASFCLPFPPGAAMSGEFWLSKIRAAEERLWVPAAEADPYNIQSLTRINQWRA